MARQGRSRFVALVAVMLASFAPSLAEEDAAQAPVDTGTWRIEPAESGDAKPDEIALRTPAIDNDEASLTLRCRLGVTLYEFVLRDPRLARLPVDGVSMAMGNGSAEPARLMGVTRGDGSVLVQERAHQTTFSLLLSLAVPADVEKLDLAIGDDRWAFPLHGFTAGLKQLTERCGFPPDPTRARKSQ